MCRQPGSSHSRSPGSCCLPSGYAAGRADRHLVELYRRQISRTAKELLDLATPSKPYAEWARAGRDTDDLRRLVEPARSSEARTFRALVEPHRRELHVHCYRILGSVQDG